MEAALVLVVAGAVWFYTLFGGYKDDRVASLPPPATAAEAPVILTLTQPPSFAAGLAQDPPAPAAPYQIALPDLLATLPTYRVG